MVCPQDRTVWQAKLSQSGTEMASFTQQVPSQLLTQFLAILLMWADCLHMLLGTLRTCTPARMV